MKLKPLIFSFFMSFILFSCIQEEALNAEADIETCTVSPNDILKQDPIIKNSIITLLIKDDMDLSRVRLKFTLTRGATIQDKEGFVFYPEDGITFDFSRQTNHYVTVISEDGNWKKEYRISAVKAPFPTEYSFEHYKTEKGSGEYQEFYEITYDIVQEIWASGNPGYDIAGGVSTPNQYPTSSYDFGVQGKAVKLETKSTGKLGEMVGMRLAAGNLFIGTFNVIEALEDPANDSALDATHFGLPFEFKPLRFEGYYKFKAGEVYQDRKGNKIEDKKDICDFYAVLYETDKNKQYLNGWDILTSDRIVAMARIENPVESEEYIKFDLAFDYDSFSNQFDRDKLNNYKYNLAVVFASSIKGHLFEGAPGSTLIIDEVKIICE